jgi:hypothetical protein
MSVDAESPQGFLIWLTWLGDTTWSTSLRESLWTYPIVDTIHVLGLIGFVGAAILLDLRLAGITLTTLAVSDVVERTRRGLFSGFAVMAVTGLLLFGANPVKFAANPFFQIKLGLLAIAGLNAGFFHYSTARRMAAWDRDVVPPLRARAAGWLSLAVWTTIIAVGRLIAFYESGAGV